MDPGLLSAVSSGAFALLGAGVGAAGAALIQTRSARLEREKLSHDTRGRVNALSVAVFRQLLASCKEVERTAERRELEVLIDDEEIYSATSPMWLRWQEVIVFCDPRIAEAGKAFVEALQNLIWEIAPESSVAAILNEPRRALFQVAGPIFREAID
jgi:hypothetical protein